MGMIQMLLVLFAIVLFSTIIITVYNGLADQAGIVYTGMYQLQGLKIADNFYQKISAEIIADNSKFDSLGTYYPSDNDNYTALPPIHGVVYNINIQSSYCDSVGNPPPPPDSSYQKIEIKIWCKPPESDTLWAGTKDNPIKHPPITDRGF